MDFIFCLFVHISILSTCFASSPYWESPYEAPRICEPQKPCKLIVREYFLNGTLQNRLQTEMCSCGSGRTCPQEYGRNMRKTVRIRLRSSAKRMIMEMKHCRPLQPLQLCGPNQLALTLSGHSLIPQKVVNFNCRCEDNNPLLLQKMRYLGHEIEQDFVCTMPTCQIPRGGQVPCLLWMREDHEISYVCTCPINFKCHLSSETLNQETGMGYCQPV